MRRPVIAMCAALAALAATVPTAAAAHSDPGDHHATHGSVRDSQAATRSAARLAARSAAQTKARSRKAADSTPLSVTIDSLTPSTIPTSGRIHVSGTVTNNDSATWTRINVYAFVSADPMTTSDQLAAAASTDPATFVGSRICADGSCQHYATIDSLAPGAQATFSFGIPSSLLDATTPGVYWFGVHALGESPEGRDNLADGRARTFLPLVPTTDPGLVPTALVIPLRRPLAHADDGSLMDLAGWLRALQPGGQLRSLVDFGAGAGDRTVDWVIDPALLDAVRQLAAGNRPRSLAPNLTAGQPDGEGDGTATPTPSAVATGGPSPGSSDAAEPAASTDAAVASVDAPTGPIDAALDPVTKQVAAAAQTWLDRLTAAVQPQDQVLALPYGDTDVAAAARHDPKLYQRARTRTDSAPLLPGITATPVVASPSGYLSESGLRLATGSTVLATDQMFKDPPPTVADVDGQQVVVTSTGGAAGGPGPDDPTSVTAMRQRLLAEAAVRVLRPDPAPLVVQLPHDWNPSSSSAYFAGLDVPWLELTTVSSAASRATPRPVAPDQLRYPKWQAADELDAANFASAEHLIDAGDSLQSLLTLNNLVSATVTDEALGTTSYSARSHPDATRADADRSRYWIDTRLAEVHVSGPESVTLSSSTGKFSATLTNSLDQPVTVSLRAKGGQGLRIEGPARVDVPASHGEVPGRTSVLLNAHAGENGVHDVTLVVTDKRGVPIGGTTTMTIRSAQVSNLIWLIMAIGAILLFGTIGVRLVRRIRAARRGPSSGAAGEDASATHSARHEARQPAGVGTR